MPYEQQIHVSVSGLEQGERAIAQTAALEERTKRLAGVIADRIAGDEKLIGKQLDLIKAETTLEGLRERHRMQTERLTATNDKAAASQEKLNTATRKTVTDVQAASAAIRAMEGTLSIRAVEQFTTKMLGMGPAMQALFPLVGGMAMINILERGVMKVGELYNAWNPIITAQEKSLKILQDSNREFDGLIKKADQYRLDTYERQHGRSARLGLEADEAAGDVKYQDAARIRYIQGQIQKQQSIAGSSAAKFPIMGPAGAIGDISYSGPSDTQRQAARETLVGLYAQLEEAQLRQKVDGLREQDLRAKQHEGDDRKVSAIENQALELRKRAAEAMARAYFGGSLEGKAAYDNVKLRIEEADALRRDAEQSRLSHTPSQAASIRASYTLLRTAAFGENADAIARRNQGEGFALDDVSLSSLAKRGDLAQERLDSRELQSLLLSGGPTVPPGYRTARQDLRNVQDSERRYMSLYRVSAQLAGTSEGGQVSSMYGARTGFADAEYKAKIRDLTLTDIQRADALEAKNQKIFDAQMEREQSLMEIALRQKEAFQKGVVGLLSAARSGGAGGAQKYLQSQLENIEDTIVGNAAGMAWKSVAKIVPHAKDGTLAGDLLKGTPFGPDPLKTAGVTLNSAGVKLSVAAEALMRAAAARSAGGGGGGGGLPGFGGGSSVGSSGGGGGGYSDSPGSGETDVEYSGLPGGGVNGDYAGETDNPAASAGRSTGSYAMAAGGAAASIYGAIKSKSTKGKLSGAGDATMSIGAMIPPPVGPFVIAAGAIMKAASLFVPDHKQERSAAIQSQLAAGQWIPPVSIDASMTTQGGYADYDRFGGVRGSNLSPFPSIEPGYKDANNGYRLQLGRTLNYFGGGYEQAVNVPPWVRPVDSYSNPMPTVNMPKGNTPTPQVNITVHALDARSIVDRHQEIGSAVLMALDKGHTGLSERLHGN
jgi:hypothetical protein